MICEHEWEEDELSKKGIIIMMNGTLDNMRREIRLICRKCGEVEFQEKEND